MLRDLAVITFVWLIILTIAAYDWLRAAMAGVGAVVRLRDGRVYRDGGAG